MPETFLGDLTQVKPVDMLKPLFSGKKTGRIIFKGKEGGELYLELGNITHAKTSDAVGEYAFFTLMGLSAGRALFEPDEVPSERTIVTSTERLMLNLPSQKQEWDKIKEAISSPSTVFRLSAQKSPENKNINADQWNVLSLCNGTKTVSEIAETLNWDEFRASKTILQLLQLGLLEKAGEHEPTNKKPVSETFLMAVEAELRKAIGPIAPIIISDKLSDLGAARDSLAQDEALSFVEKLSEDISRDAKKKEFVRVMTDFLNTEKNELDPKV